MNLEKIIFNNLINNEEYTRKVIPFLKEEYFSSQENKQIFTIIDNYIKLYNKMPSKEALLVDLSNMTMTQETHKACYDIIASLEKTNTNDEQWLIDNTEKFCQEKAVYNAIMDSIHILDDKTGKQSKGSIPQILSDALSVSFDSHIGHDFLEDFDKRFDFYHTKEAKIQFDLDYFNKITRGGLSKKTLNIVLAGCVHPNTEVKIRFRKKV